MNEALRRQAGFPAVLYFVTSELFFNLTFSHAHHATALFESGHECERAMVLAIADHAAPSFPWRFS